MTEEGVPHCSFCGRHIISGGQAIYEGEELVGWECGECILARTIPEEKVEDLRKLQSKIY